VQRSILPFSVSVSAFQLYPNPPFPPQPPFPASGLATGSLNGLNPKSNFLAIRHQDSVTATNQGQALFDEIVSIQDWVTERYPVSRSTRKKIDDYRNQLRNTMLGPRLVNP
jgi:hypothetical protein